ncbi:MAG: beta-lactamase family protein [Kouleothrix sp.]|nr:beta-lactamase family protein [Kouleothrix sp.]
MNRLQRAVGVADAAVREGGYPSAVIAVASSSATILKRALSRPGMAPAREDSIFLLASITKPIVATAIMRLVEDGLLLLSAPVATYIPEFAQAGKQLVTTWHILTHTSGLDDSAWQAELAGARRATAPELVQLACRSGLRFEPGARFEYCSFSFYILAELISRLGGAPYPELLRRQIFRPLGMRDTSFAPEGDQRARAMPVYGLAPDFDRWLAYYTSVATPGGGLWSTAADLIAFGQALLRGGRAGDYHLLSPAAIETMARLQTGGLTQVSDGQTTPAMYGLGWGKLGPEALASPRAYLHGGATGTLLCIDPEWDLVFVFLTNQWDIQGTAADRALNAVYGALRRDR